MDCSYHPDKSAVIICERCKRPICNEDKRIYKKKFDSSNQEKTSNKLVDQYYCVICNGTKIKNDNNPYKIIPINIVILMFLIIDIIKFPNTLKITSTAIVFFFLFIFIQFFLVIIAVWITSSKKQNQEIEREVLEFKKSINSVKNSDLLFAENKNIKNIIFSIDCHSCGTLLELKDKNCPKCGNIEGTVTATNL